MRRTKRNQGTSRRLHHALPLYQSFTLLLEGSTLTRHYRYHHLHHIAPPLPLPPPPPAPRLQPLPDLFFVCSSEMKQPPAKGVPIPCRDSSFKNKASSRFVPSIFRDLFFVCSSETKALPWSIVATGHREGQSDLIAFFFCTLNGMMAMMLLQGHFTNIYERTTTLLPSQKFGR